MRCSAKPMTTPATLIRRCSELPRTSPVNSAFQRHIATTLISLLSVAFAFGAEPTATPKTFKAFLDAFPGPSYIVELRGTTIHYEEYRRRFEPTGRLVHDGSTTAKITPTAEQWREFRRGLDGLNIWRWLPTYDNPAVADGITWRFEVSFSDHALKTEGSNNYPNEKGALGRDNEKFPPDISPTPTFDRLLAAIRKLIGDRPFKYQ